MIEDLSILLRGLPSIFKYHTGFVGGSAKGKQLFGKGEVRKLKHEAKYFIWGRGQHGHAETKYWWNFQSDVCIYQTVSLILIPKTRMTLPFLTKNVFLLH